ncbi:putative hydrolase [Gordonia effusa NBRC 100432]|uniref:Putative hydrolase n=1 Tax=Gordonia effusa NBRC 100432 TaxID=1077974 RepID=H0QUM3_9ACTN|nr:amidohydrolase family protein [Gordonia effusa]GAB16524.1 putative hydrolase [Gordonia effusa NBRC 100432]
MATDAKPARIDVHHHALPPQWAQLTGMPGGGELPKWSVDSTLEFMDTRGIATAIMSVSAPGIPGESDGGGPKLTRELNEDLASVVRDYPDRFGLFASVPLLDDIDDAVREAVYALDELSADGLVVMSNYAGAYLGDSRFAPLWAELDHRRTPVFIHPTEPGLPLIHGLNPSVVEYPAETTRNAFDMAFTGTIARFPNVPFILSHAGGFLPYAAYRFAKTAETWHPDQVADIDIMLDQMRSFYFDTALSTSGLATYSTTGICPPRTRPVRQRLALHQGQRS